jgi:hypothetical protein
VSPSGPAGLFKGMTTATSGVLARFPWLLPVRNSVASYGASAVARIFRGLNPGFQRNLSQLGGTVLRGSRAVCSVYFCGTVCRSFELMGRTNFTTEFRIPWIVSMVSNLSSAEQREGHNG